MKKKGVKSKKRIKMEEEEGKQKRQKDGVKTGDAAQGARLQKEALQKEAMHGQWSVSVCWPTSTRPREGAAL